MCTNITKCINTYALTDECIECEDGYYYNKNAKKCQEADELLKNVKMEMIIIV